MTILVNSDQRNVTSGVATAIGFTPTIGSTILVYGWEEESNSNTGVTDSAGNTYTRDFNTAPTGNGQSVYRSSNIASAPTTITISGGSAVVHRAVVEVTGLLNTSPLSQAVSRTDGNPTSHSYALTTTTDNEFVFFGVGYGGNPGTFTGTGITTGLTNVVYARDAGYILDAGTAGSNPVTFTTGNGIDSYALVAAYKSATTASDPAASSSRFTTLRHTFGTRR